VSERRTVSTGIVDFVSVKNKLIIELDGRQHLEQAEYDVERSKYFESQGYKVIRFWNNQVENDIGGVIRAIGVALSENYGWLKNKTSEFLHRKFYRVYFVSNKERGNSDCRMIPNKVPVLNSSWSGTGIVTVEFLICFCMMM